MIFFVLGALLIISNNNLALCMPSNVDTFTGMYVDWLDGVYGNALSLTGKVIELEWLPREG